MWLIMVARLLLRVFSVSGGVHQHGGCGVADRSGGDWASCEYDAGEDECCCSWWRRDDDTGSLQAVISRHHHHRQQAQVSLILRHSVTAWFYDTCLATPTTPTTTTTTKTMTITMTVSMTMNKKRSERRKHCAPAVVRRSQKKSPRRRPPSPGRRTAKI